VSQSSGSAQRSSHTVGVWKGLVSGDPGLAIPEQARIG